MQKLGQCDQKPLSDTVQAVDLQHPLLVPKRRGKISKEEADLNGMSCVYSDLIICGVSVLQAQVIVLQLQVNVWEDELHPIGSTLRQRGPRSEAVSMGMTWFV